MRAPFTQLYLHCVWGTWDRLPLISLANEQAIYASIRSKCEGLKCEVLAIGGIEEHIHLLIRIPTTISVSELMKEVKGTSSHLVTHQVEPGEFFKWQGAYGAFTISKELVPKLKAYVEHQKEHHAENDLMLEWESMDSEA
jgi:REP element-mobilizing transposase RayT